MRGRGLLAAYLLAVGLCFVPVLGHGEVVKWITEWQPSPRDFWFLQARVEYIMQNPTSFLRVHFGYGPSDQNVIEGIFPAGVDYRGKILVHIYDNRDVFSYKSGVALLDQFKKELEVIYSFIIEGMVTDMDTDIAAILYTEGGRPLAYFYQGEYYLWGEKEK